MMRAILAVGIMGIGSAVAAAIAGLPAVAEDTATLAPPPGAGGQTPDVEAEIGASGRRQPRVQDTREAFDQATALAAEGRIAEARELLTAVSQSEDLALAALAHYNLGCLAASQARGVFRAVPEELPAAQREEGLALLAQACQHFRQCLACDPQHADARHNLELLRLWIGANRHLWQTREPKSDGTAASPKPAGTPAGKPQTRPAASPGKNDAKSPPSGAQGSPKQGPQAKGPADDGPGSQAMPADPLRQFAEDLMAKVRQRIQDRRQREQSRLRPRWKQLEEKDW